MKILKYHIFALVPFVLYSYLAFSHPGKGEESGPLMGCHPDDIDESYHCHIKSSLKGQSFNSRNHALKKINFLKNKLFEENPVEYERSLYSHWVDKDQDCQNTRAEVLIRDSIGPVKFKRQSGYFQTNIADLGRKEEGPDIKKPCNISHGKWKDPYTENKYTKAIELDIDHVISLKHAHSRGGKLWDHKKRKAFANDPINLLAVEKSINRQKGSKSIEDWLPPSDKFKCTYAKLWEKVKKKYDLQITSLEKKAINKIKKEWCEQ